MQTVAEFLAEQGFSTQFYNKTVGEKTGQTFLNMMSNKGTASTGGVVCSLVLPAEGFDGDVKEASFNIDTREVELEYGTVTQHTLYVGGEGRTNTVKAAGSL